MWDGIRCRLPRAVEPEEDQEVELDHDSLLTVDAGSRASHPGRVVVSMFRWTVCFPTWPLTLGAALLVATALTVQKHWGYVFLAVVFAAMNFLYWKRLREHFLFGCANPAVVIATHPCLVAVYTDLTKGQGEFPVIKVVRFPRRALGTSVRIGDRVPTVSLYGNNAPTEPHWYDFFPLPVTSATSKQEVVARVVQDLGDAEWASLDQHLAHVTTLTTPGLYFTELPPEGDAQAVDGEEPGERSD